MSSVAFNKAMRHSNPPQPLNRNTFAKTTGKSGGEEFSNSPGMPLKAISFSLIHLKKKKKSFPDVGNIHYCGDHIK